MKKQILKTLSGFLAVLLLITVITPAVSVSAEEVENIPIVFVGGRGTYLKDSEGNQIFPLQTYDKQYIIDACKVCLPLLAKAMITNNYDEYCDALYESIANVYRDIPLDNDGNASDGSGTNFTWTKKSLSAKVKYDKPYGLNDYTFYYDWRLDPCETADILNDYINDVLEVTGASKVNIVGRCMGGNIVMAYLTEYGCSKVDTTLFYATTVNGTVGAGAPFAGELELHSDAIDRYATDYLGDDTLGEFLKASVSLLESTYGLDITTALLTNIYEKIANNVVPRLLLATYATCPSYWSMVGDDYFEAAKQNVFGGQEDEYAELIKKIDNYHYNVEMNVASNLKQFEAAGMNIAVVCKYGRQVVPVTKARNELSDDTVELKSASFGATCCEVNSQLSDEYIKSAEKNGLGGYISPDKQVDASTCLFPDNTWIIKNNAHTDFAKSIDTLMLNILRFDGRMTVDDDESYSQYLLYNQEDSSISTMTQDNYNTDDRWNHNIFEVFINFVKTLFAYLKQLFSNLNSTQAVA